MPIRHKAAEIPTSYATCSIGYRESHTLPLKLKAIADAGFDAVELSMPDILAYGKMLNGTEPDPTDYDTLVEIGTAIKGQMVEHGLEVMMLQPFANFEGWPKGSPEREDAFARARGWMRVMEAVGTDLLQVGSSDAPGIAGASFDDMAADLAELADLLAAKGFRVAYENWCWATRAPAWKDVWDLVQKADRPNLGLCLDTFQSGGGEWADPTTRTGLVEAEIVVGGAGTDEGEGEGAGEGETRRPMYRAQVEQRWSESLAELVVTVPAAKIFLLQISDAYKMDPPLADEVDAESGLRPRGQWSHDHRPLPYDGGYLPVREFLNAVLDTGFRGYLSMEVFDPKGQERRYPDMGAYAKKAMDGLEKLLVA
ncbi:uncharacterized protein PG998_011852 [Apiospora kogelbergensis]|uniref:uncharacterized protein n=1 Tax=Apiospora kogelbergensis TaxID=1337665 RepID=UPI00312F96A1